MPSLLPDMNAISVTFPISIFHLNVSLFWSSVYPFQCWYLSSYSFKTSFTYCLSNYLNLFSSFTSVLAIPRSLFLHIHFRSSPIKPDKIVDYFVKNWHALDTIFSFVEYYISPLILFLYFSKMFFNCLYKISHILW